MNDYDNEDYITDTGTDYTFNISSDTISLNSNSSYIHNVSMAPSTITLDTITDTSSWEDRLENFDVIDLDLLEKYPTAKSLYKQFINVYNICKVNEEMEE